MGFNLGGAIGGIIGDIGAAIIGQKENNKDRQQQDQANQQNADLQMQFAQNGLRWKVADAVAAGIHPLAALGAQGYNASPSYVSGGADHTMSDLSRNLGQSINRAVTATQTNVEREMSNLALERAKLENNYLKEQITSEQYRRGNVGPPMPGAQSTYLEGQGDLRKGLGANDGRVQDVPFRRVYSDLYNPAKEAGAIPDFQIARTHKGGYAVVPGSDMKNRIEDSPMEYQWLIRNSLRTYTMPNGNTAVMNPLTGNLMPVWKKSWTDKYKKWRNK